MNDSFNIGKERFKLINGNTLKNAMISGTNNICKNRLSVDKLNIFPVPDGDTGTNMSMTMKSCAEALSEISEQSVSKMANKISSLLIRGSRGNSGVILSKLFQGFASGLNDIEEASGSDLARALGAGVDSAYGAVMKPTEGTMLTVARVAFEKGLSASVTNSDPIFVWEEVCKGANEALESTPELLPVLKKAGVVDAGGKGLVTIFEGMLSVFRDAHIIENEEVSQEIEDDDDFRNATMAFDEEINFTYCTELTINKENENKPEALRAYLEKIGDCVLVVDDNEIIKVHVHTDNPGSAISKALEFGSLIAVKVENMRQQNKTILNNLEVKSKEKLEFAEPVEDVGFVAVAAGEGVISLFSDLGCSNVITGGQTMNPSTDDILEAVLATPAKVVYVFPNNKNILLSAKQAATLVKDRTVAVIPTNTIPEGMTALLAYDGNLSFEENFNAMTEAAAKIKTGQITFAARNSEFYGFKIKENDILSFENGKLVHVDKDKIKSLIKLVKLMTNRKSEFVTVIYGADVTEEEANRAHDLLKSKINSHIDVTMIKGNQPVYYFIVSVE